MRREAPQKLTDYAPLAFPAGMLMVFFVVPFSVSLRASSPTATSSSKISATASTTWK